MKGKEITETLEQVVEKAVIINWQDNRYCKYCNGVNIHKENCIIPKIEKILLENNFNDGSYTESNCTECNMCEMCDK